MKVGTQLRRALSTQGKIVTVQASVPCAAAILQQAQLLHKLSINFINELVQAIDRIFLSQSSDAIVHRQFLFLQANLE